MIPELTVSNKTYMSLSQIHRYEKKRTKMLHNSRYYIQYYGYDVALHDWSLEKDDDGYIYIKGVLENGNNWITSDVISMINMDDHYKITTTSKTIYRLY